MTAGLDLAKFKFRSGAFSTTLDLRTWNLRGTKFSTDYGLYKVVPKRSGAVVLGGAAFVEAKC
eukprot:SAG31_NODE_1515_length_8037_cov_2.470773_1_plen_63_part_00